MPRLVIVMACATLFFSACAASNQPTSSRSYANETRKKSEQRPTWEDRQPQNADEYIERALDELEDSRRLNPRVDAMISLGQAINRDQWHLEANQLYQQLHIEEFGWASTVERYRTLYGKFTDEPVAIYLYVRALLWERKGISLREVKKLETRRLAEEMLKRAQQAGSFEERAELCVEVIRTDKHFVPAYAALGNVVREEQRLIDRVPGIRIRDGELFNSLADEALFEADGNLLYAAHLTAPEPPAPLVRLQESLAQIPLGLPGFFPYFGLAEAAEQWAETLNKSGETTALRGAEAMVRLAIIAYELCAEAKMPTTSEQAYVDRAKNALSRLEGNS